MENSEVILNLTQDERAFRCCYRRRDIIVYKIVPVGTEKWTSHALNDSLFVNIFSSALQNVRKMFVCLLTSIWHENKYLDIICSLQLSFLRASLSEISAHHGKDNVCEQLSEHIFTPHGVYYLFVSIMLSIRLLACKIHSTLTKFSFSLSQIFKISTTLLSTQRLN